MVVNVDMLDVCVRITNCLTLEIAEVPLTSTIIIKIFNMDLVFILLLLPIKASYIQPFTLLVSIILLTAELPKTCQIIMDSCYSINTTFIHTAAHLIFHTLSLHSQFTALSNCYVSLVILYLFKHHSLLPPFSHNHRTIPT
jgi:hypothetical protein